MHFIEDGIAYNLIKLRVGECGDMIEGNTMFDCVDYTRVAHQGPPGMVIHISNLEKYGHEVKLQRGECGKYLCAEQERAAVNT